MSWRMVCLLTVFGVRPTGGTGSASRVLSSLLICLGLAASVRGERVESSPASASCAMPDLPAAVAAMPMPQAGAHPRVLFTRDELPAIRARAKTPGGQAAVAAVAWEADFPGKPVLENARAGKPETAQSLTIHAFHQAFLWLVTGETGRLDNARVLLGAWTVQHAPQKSFGDAWRDGYRFALAYDWLHDDLPAGTRNAMRETMAAGMSAETLDGWEHLGYIKGPIKTGRPCDWGAIASGSMLMQWMAIAGEDGRASREFLGAIVDLMRYIADFGMTAEGYMFAGNGYAAGDFINYGYAVRALQVHGIPLVDHPHLQAFATWLAYESIPGQYVFDTRNFSNGYHQGLSPLVLTLAARHGGVAAWLADQGRGPDRVGTPYRMGEPGVLWYDFSATPVPPPDLPLYHWSSSMGVSFSRAGWNAGSYFCLSMEPLVPSKTHPDKGTFTFYSHGQNFAADPEDIQPASVDHNIVLIDGKGQHDSGGEALLDAIPRGFLASGIADLNHLDVKPAYERHLAYTRTRPGPVDWTKLEYGRGLPFRWEVYRPMRHADRYGLYVRGSVHPYVVILDDIQQDDAERQYQWLLHSKASGEIAGPGHARFSSRYGGEYVQAETTASVTFSAEVPTAGNSRVWVLARKWPQLKNYFSHHIAVDVNGIRTGSFRPADHLDDWQWYDAGECVLRAGKNDVAVSGGRGFRVAQVVAIPGTNAPPSVRVRDGQPQGEAPAGMVVFKRQADMKSAEWSVHRDPCARMDLFFLQPGSAKLELDFWKKPRAVPPALRAGQKAVRAGFAAVLVPYDDLDPAPAWSPTNDCQAVLKWGPFTDYLYADPAHLAANVAGAPILTDGKFALVRTRGEELAGYILVAGTRLAFRGKTVVEGSTGPLQVLNDGATCAIQTPPAGAKLRILRLGASEALINHRRQALKSATEMTPLRVKALPTEWNVALSADGRLVTITGNGPLPLKIQAPKALKCVVNDVSVWFSRDGFGNIYPKIELTELTHGREPANSTPADAVAREEGTAPIVEAAIPLPRDGWRFRKDPENAGRDRRWFDVAFNDQDWAPIGIGDFWDSFGVRHTGVGWYRCTFRLPEKPARGDRVELAFDAVDEMAWVWLNGELAGEYFEFGPAGWQEPFSFDVTKRVRWGAENQITVRVENTAGGGIYKPVALRVLSPQTTQQHAVKGLREGTVP